MVRARVSLEASTATIGALLGLLDIDQREAAAVAGERSALLQALMLVAAGNGEASAVALDHNSYVADNAGEHLAFRRHQVIRSGPNARDCTCVK